VVGVLGWVVHMICIYISNRVQARNASCEGCGRRKKGGESGCGECDAAVEKQDMAVSEVQEKSEGQEEKSLLMGCEMG